MPGDGTVVILWWVSLAMTGTAAAVWLTGGALASWREQRAGLVYELTPRYRGVAVRAGAAVAALGCVLAGGTGLALAPVDTITHTRSSGPTPPALSPVPAPDATVTASSAPSSAAGAMLTVGHPSGGALLEGPLPGVQGRVRVWLPQQYAKASIPLPVMVVRADDAELGDVFEGLSGAVDSGRSNAFVAVVPTPPCNPAGADVAAAGDLLRHAVAARFHVAPDARGWGLLGLDAGAPCAVEAELARPGSFIAAAGLGGRYDDLVRLMSHRTPHLPPHPAAHPATLPPATRLLLADSRRDAAGQDSAARLRSALVRLPRADVRLSSVVRDFSVQRERLRLVRLAAGYLTEQLAAGR